MAAWETEMFPVTGKEIEDFLEGVGEAAGTPPVGRQHLLVRGGVALSFDRDWFAFVGSTPGFNPDGARRYVNDEVVVVNRLRKVLQRYAARTGQRVGGRFFFDGHGVSRDSDGERHWVVLWQRS